MNPITMPWPEKQVWPNFRQSHHWRSYHKQRKAQRELAQFLAREAGLYPIWDFHGLHIPIVVEITPPDKRRRDRDGMVGACKGILDGICDWMGVNDQYLAPDYRFMPPQKPGSVVVRMGTI